MVEFFDYNCGFCKRAMTDMLDLMKNDGKLKVVLKEFPVLGEGSVEAAHVAVAVRMQDKTGKKYIDFHQKLLGGRGPADKARALAAAKEAGFDMARIEKDMQSDEVKADPRREPEARRGAGRQRHAELRDRHRGRGRRRRARRAQEEDRRGAELDIRNVTSLSPAGRGSPHPQASKLRALTSPDNCGAPSRHRHGGFPRRAWYRCRGSRAGRLS